MSPTREYLREAIAETVSDDISRMSDGILRVSLPKDWPVAEAIRSLGNNDELKVLVQRPFQLQDFQDLSSTDDAAKCTQWRNDPERSYKIVIVGDGTGSPLGSGLEDVEQVARNEVIKAWRDTIKTHCPPDGNLSKEAIGELIRVLYNFVEDFQD